MSEVEGCGRLAPAGHLEPHCDCYQAGYEQGRDSALAEAMYSEVEGHPAGCDCDPCKFIRRVTGYDPQYRHGNPQEMTNG